MTGRNGNVSSLEDKTLGTAKVICRESARQGTEVMGEVGASDNRWERNGEVKSATS